MTIKIPFGRRYYHLTFFVCSSARIEPKMEIGTMVLHLINDKHKSPFPRKNDGYICTISDNGRYPDYYTLKGEHSGRNIPMVSCEKVIPYKQI